MTEVQGRVRMRTTSKATVCIPNISTGERRKRLAGGGIMLSLLAVVLCSSSPCLWRHHQSGASSDRAGVVAGIFGLPDLG